MKNITLSIDNETYRLARIAAAQREQSVSATVRDLISETVKKTDEDHAKNMKRLFEIFDNANPNATNDWLTRDEMYSRARRS
jgi:hypothetical protein